jgi:REP element-mobilizing transposase RayT
MPGDVRFFDPFADIRRHGMGLPHWEQPGASYFVTFRLADAVPVELREQWKEERAIWLRLHPQPWSAEAEREYHRRFSQPFDQWLDAGHGACVLREVGCRECVVATLLHSHDRQYWLHAWVVMPNHGHVLFSLHPEASLAVEIGAWKSVSARGINRRLGRSGTLWQEDYFDRLIRDEEHFANCARYIRRNPGKAHLREGEYACFESEFATAMAKE